MENALPQRRSATAVIITTIYVLLAVAAFAILFLAKEDESLAGIFVVLVAMPWSMLLTSVTASIGIDSMAFNTVFSALACVLNAWIIYSVISFFARR